VNINPFIILINNIISFYSFALFSWIVISTLINFNIVNSYQPFVLRVMGFLDQIILPPIRFIRKFIPTIAGIDLSPMVLILALQLIKNILITYFYK